MAAHVTDTMPGSAPNLGPSPRTAPEAQAAGSRLTSASVWREVARHSFAVLGHVNAAGEPRTSGVVYGLVGHRLYVAVAPDSWKARHIETGEQVALTVPVRRGGIMTLLFPIPPATISFHARATVHPAGSPEVASLPNELAHLLPEESCASSCVIELVPDGQFLTYGLGVSLGEMRDPALAGAHIPVG